MTVCVCLCVCVHVQVCLNIAHAVFEHSHVCSQNPELFLLLTNTHANVLIGLFCEYVLSFGYIVVFCLCVGRLCAYRYLLCICSRMHAHTNTQQHLVWWYTWYVCVCVRVCVCACVCVCMCMCV